ncbi:abietadienol/abietadienal oxidase-like [Cryptomeria japonica]|uniref:abietadienol/abietadienal oxidase-like n=1 Tax=Cryptomeria japonica TaxID=3369 RepID=UPI0025ABF7F4|nr:abietadienol/abietadienal oxidase-like [Cryptomeria japonica]
MGQGQDEEHDERLVLTPRDVENLLKDIIGRVIEQQGQETTKDFNEQGKEKKVPPTSKGLPFLGHTLLWFYYMAKPDPLAFLHKYILPYGEMVTCSMFGRPIVVSVDPEFNKFVLQNEGRLFKASYFKSLHDLMGMHSMISVTGDLHRQLHGSAVNLLTNEKLRRNFMPAIQVVFKQTMTKWEGREIVLQPECKRLVLNVMAEHLLNVSKDIETDELFSLVTDFINGIVSVPVEMLGCGYAKGLSARRILSSKFDKLMDERKINPRDDLLSKLVNEENLPKEIVTDFLLILLVASYETASRTMAIAIHFLSQSKEALGQLTEEHETIQKHKGDEKLQWEDYKKMKFTQCVINEALRLSSIAVGLVRETTEDVKAKGGYVIPKGWGVMIFFYAVHMNGKFFNDPLKFNPWRWQGKDKEELLWKNYDMRFSPFGGGRRLCPGADLARISISFFLHYFVTKFRWEIVKEGRITFFPIPHIEGGLPIRLFAKSPTSLE